MAVVTETISAALGNNRIPVWEAKMENIHFGLIGIKIGDIIRFKPTGDKFKVASGNGTPENGGDLISSEQILGTDLFSIKLATRRLLGKQFKEQADLWKMWEFKGKTLKELYDRKALNNERKSKCV